MPNKIVTTIVENAEHPFVSYFLCLSDITFCAKALIRRL